MALLSVPFLVSLIAAACDSGSFNSPYRVELPPLPPEWLAILGEPRWSIEWVNKDGNRERLDDASGAEIQLLQEFSSPVSAYPYWPGRGIAPGTMYPAGAIFPYDAKDGRITLTWLGGVEAAVYSILAKAGSGDSVRQPQYFDWPRFKALLEGDDIPAAVRDDPWIVDWEAVGVKTVESGFDRRRIVARAREELLIPSSVVPGGLLWVGASPFARPVAGDPLCFQVSSAVDRYFSSGGVLHVTQGLWIIIPHE